MHRVTQKLCEGRECFTSAFCGYWGAVLETVECRIKKLHHRKKRGQ